MKLSYKINTSLSFIFIVLFFSAIGIFVNIIVPKFDENIFSNDLNDRIKLFLEIVINLLIIYAIVSFFFSYAKEPLLHIFNLKDNDLFFFNELFIFIIIFVNNNVLIEKIKNFINNIIYNI